MTTLTEDLHALRLRAITELFTQLPAAVTYLAVQIDGDPIESAEYSDDSGKVLYPYPEPWVLAPLNALFGHRHEGLSTFAVPYSDIPDPVKTALLSMSAYREGLALVLRRPVTDNKAAKFTPARENGEKSYTAVIQGGLAKTQEVWAQNAGAARRKVSAKLIRHARIVQIRRTPAGGAPRT